MTAPAPVVSFQAPLPRFHLHPRLRAGDHHVLGDGKADLSALK